MSACSLALAADVPALTHYIVVRADLPLGFLAAQVAHAAGESSPGDLPCGTHAIVLAASPERLAELEAVLARERIGHVAIREPDPPWLGALTAIGLDPVSDRAQVRRYLSSLPLLGRRAGGGSMPP